MPDNDDKNRKLEAFLRATADAADWVDEHQLPAVFQDLARLHAAGDAAMAEPEDDGDATALSDTAGAPIWNWVDVPRFAAGPRASGAEAATLGKGGADTPAADTAADAPPPPHARTRPRRVTVEVPAGLDWFDGAIEIRVIGRGDRRKLSLRLGSRAGVDRVGVAVVHLKVDGQRLPDVTVAAARKLSATVPLPQGTDDDPAIAISITGADDA